jgi:hypothetical protein
MTWVLVFSMVKYYYFGVDNNNIYQGTKIDFGVDNIY